MAYGNKFVKVKGAEEPVKHRAKAKTPDGVEYLFDPTIDPKAMKPWEVTGAIRYFMDRQPQAFKKPASKKPNRFIHIQR